MVMGFAGIYFCQYVNYRILEKVVYLAYLLSIVFIVALHFLAEEVNGAKRWLDVGPVSFQVAEITKVAIIIFLAFFIKKCTGKLNSVAITILAWILGGIQAGLILKISSDLSSAVVILGITFFMTFVITKAFKLHMFTLCGGLVVVFWYVKDVYDRLPATSAELDEFPYRFQRIAGWLAPERYLDDQSFQPMQAEYAIGSGGLFGKGLGQSIQKIKYIPEAQNDMILSVIGEELGVLGITVLMILYVYLLYLLVRVARHAQKDLFGAACVVGIFAHIACQTIINVAVNAGAFPNTGIPLPFVSYGGTSVLILLMEIALVLSVERRRYIRQVALALEKKRRRDYVN